MDVTIKKVTERDGQERFVLVNAKTRDVLTVHDVSEPTLRRFFLQRGMSDELIDGCLVRARERYQQDIRGSQSSVDEASDTIPDDDLLFELGLGADDDDALT